MSHVHIPGSNLHLFQAGCMCGKTKPPIYSMAPFNISMLADKAKIKLLNEKKATGPDGIMPKLLKTNMLFKESTIIAVP